MRCFLVLALLGPLVAVACGTPPVNTCVPGRNEACPCPGGASGVQSCRDNGTFGPCECGGNVLDAAADVEALEGGQAQEDGEAFTDASRADATAAPDAPPSCGAGEQLCNGTCINTQGDDVANCGGCGFTCDRPNATPACRNGQCLQTCMQGYQDCDNNILNGCERSVSADVMNCGMCSRACLPADGAADATCSGGLCSYTCQAGRGDCDGQNWNACETDTTANRNHCGTCGNACPTYPHMLWQCTNGTCSGNCAPDYANCNGNLMDGCESNLTSDRNHCGSCSTSCGTRSCVNSRCT